MSFHNSSPEPKQLFLTLLINLDFQIASNLYILKNHSLAVSGMFEILTLVCGRDKRETKPIWEKIEGYYTAGTAPIADLCVQFYELQLFLNDKYFSELQLGIIPTSTIKGDDKKPDTSPLSATQSSRI
jgi:hypothetical protein